MAGIHMYNEIIVSSDHDMIAPVISTIRGAYGPVTYAPAIPCEVDYIKTKFDSVFTCQKFLVDDSRTAIYFINFSCDQFPVEVNRFDKILMIANHPESFPFGVYAFLLHAKMIFPEEKTDRVFCDRVKESSLNKKRISPASGWA